MKVLDEILEKENTNVPIRKDNINTILEENVDLPEDNIELLYRKSPL
jgi:hypothetical protein